MKSEDLRVEIESRFKEKLEARFNLDNFDEEGINDSPCPLCDIYCVITDTTHSIVVIGECAVLCKGCPFERFRDECGFSEYFGCINWMELVHEGIHNVICMNRERIGFHDTLDLDGHTNKKEFSAFVEKAKKLITFVDEYNGG